MSDQEILKSIDSKLMAILTLLIEKRENISSGELEKIEVILQRGGLGSPEIAVVLNKNTASVQKTLQRAKKKGN